ncbi:MAG: Hpt domain-containing protein [Leptolyngbya sp. BL-A-14]
MQATKQQQILGYFIEEAKEHLDTIEQGLLDLQATMADTERLNEMFRAAHSVKGGAAMLGFSSIHKVGHHLEDCFKLLTDHPVKIDQHLENLFLQGFDLLKELVEELQSPYGLREEDAAQAVQAAEPTFVELQNYLNRLLQGERAESQPAINVAQPLPAANPELPNRLNGALKMMLQLFKQGDTPTNRQQLATLCSRMVSLHNAPEWRTLLQAVLTAIANPRHTYAALAPLIIKELKLAGDLLIAGRGSEIVPSQQLRQFMPATKPVAVPQPVAAPQPIAPPPSPEVTHHPVREAVTPKANQIIIPAEPRAAARALLEAFNKAQLIELAEFLMKAIQ